MNEAKQKTLCEIFSYLCALLFFILMGFAIVFFAILSDGEKLTGNLEHTLISYDCFDLRNVQLKKKAEVRESLLRVNRNSGSLRMERDRAFTLFSQKKYAQSHDKFSYLKRIYDDPEIRFYSAYSLFLTNKTDSSNYEFFLAELSELKRLGYEREEIDEMMDFINGEKENLEIKNEA